LAVPRLSIKSFFMGLNRISAAKKYAFATRRCMCRMVNYNKNGGPFPEKPIRAARLPLPFKGTWAGYATCRSGGE
jgi:hypothetical protein